MLNPNCFEGSKHEAGLTAGGICSMKDQWRESRLHVHKWKAMEWLTTALYQNQFGHSPIWVLLKIIKVFPPDEGHTKLYTKQKDDHNWGAGFLHGAQAQCFCCRSFPVSLLLTTPIKMNNENCQCQWCLQERGRKIAWICNIIRMGSMIYVATVVQTCWGPKLVRHKLNRQFQGQQKAHQLSYSLVVKKTLQGNRLVFLSLPKSNKYNTTDPAIGI